MSEANDTHEQNLIHVDIPGLPLGATEDDFRDIPEDPVDDDAVVLDATGKIFFLFCDYFFLLNDKNFIDPLEGDFFEGDMILPLESAKNHINSQASRWPGGTVPYVIEGTFSE